MTDFFRRTYVMERVNDAMAVRYVCYEDLRNGKFCVSSGDVLRRPESAETLSWQAVHEVDHFIEQGVSRWFDTLLEAVEDFAPVMETERRS